MSRLELKLAIRFVVVALIWAAVSACADRAAVAGGCHAAERPVLGLTFAWAVEPLSASAREPRTSRPPAFAPTPCQGDSNGNTIRDVLRVPCAPSMPFPWRVEPSRAVPASADSTIESHPDAERLDRPPRA